MLTFKRQKLNTRFFDIRRESGFRLGLIHRRGLTATEGSYTFTLGVPKMNKRFEPMRNGEPYVSPEEIAEIEAKVAELNS